MQNYTEEFFAQYPRRVTWKEAAEIVSRHEFKAADRTIRTWGLRVTYPNGRATVDTRDLMAEAVHRQESATSICPRPTPSQRRAVEEKAELSEDHGPIAT